MSWKSILHVLLLYLCLQPAANWACFGYHAPVLCAHLNSGHSTHGAKVGPVGRLCCRRAWHVSRQSHSCHALPIPHAVHTITASKQILDFSQGRAANPGACKAAPRSPLLTVPSTHHPLHASECPAGPCWCSRCASQWVRATPPCPPSHSACCSWAARTASCWR